MLTLHHPRCYWSNCSTHMCAGWRMTLAFACMAIPAVQLVRVFIIEWVSMRHPPPVPAAHVEAVFANLALHELAHAIPTAFGPPWLSMTPTGDAV